MNWVFWFTRRLIEVSYLTLSPQLKAPVVNYSAYSVRRICLLITVTFSFQLLEEPWKLFVKERLVQVKPARWHGEKFNLTWSQYLKWIKLISTSKPYTWWHISTSSLKRELTIFLLAGNILEIRITKREKNLEKNDYITKLLEVNKLQNFIANHLNLNCLLMFVFNSSAYIHVEKPWDFTSLNRIPEFDFSVIHVHVTLYLGTILS